MNTKVVALLLVGIISTGLIYTHPAFAHNFGGDESASFLAKVQEIKTELQQISDNLSDHDVVSYYTDATSEYWNANDTREMGERNQLLAKEIPDTLDSIFMAANMTSPDATDVNAKIAQLNGYLDEAVPVRIDKDKLENSTVNALAITFVLQEVLEKYGDAIEANVDLNDMDSMNMTGMQSSGSMTGMQSMAVPIKDEDAYDNSKALAATAQTMFDDLQTKNPSVTQNSKIASGFEKLVKDLDNKSEANTIMMDVHVGIHPDLIAGYKIQQAAVPEFPLPLLLIVVAFSALIFATRMKTKIGPR